MGATPDVQLTLSALRAEANQVGKLLNQLEPVSRLAYLEMQLQLAIVERLEAVLSRLSPPAPSPGCATIDETAARLERMAAAQAAQTPQDGVELARQVRRLTRRRGPLPSRVQQALNEVAAFLSQPSGLDPAAESDSPYLSSP